MTFTEGHKRYFTLTAPSSTVQLVLQGIAICLTLLCTTLHSNARDYWNHKIDQDNVGSCHSFATLALIEAEFWKATGKHIDLSERELFVRHYLKDYGSFDKMIASQLERATRRTVEVYYKESGHIKDDFKLLQQHGVSLEKDLPYSSFFKLDLPMAMRNLRHARHAVTREMFLSRKAETWNTTKKEQVLTNHTNLRSTTNLRSIFTLPKPTTTHEHVKQFCSNYSLRKLTPKTTPLAKKIIIQQLHISPVAVDVSNYQELTRSNTHVLYERHSFVVSQYHPKNDSFTIRSSTTGDGKQVNANALARGCYQIYFLEKK
ncbi:hypothetical protein ACFPK9_05720 [Rubritalea spongiae]|uniref:Peptidase C1A papain C-terminal domain-containing protein n=1 Tax=Rubritalea spongiae TaxID=430797 RepID=A0ABW5E6Q8_9BACT